MRVSIHTGISVAGEVASPLDKGASLELAGSNGIAADCGENRGIAKLGFGGNDTIGDVVVDSLQSPTLSALLSSD